MDFITNNRIILVCFLITMTGLMVFRNSPLPVSALLLLLALLSIKVLRMELTGLQEFIINGLAVLVVIMLITILTCFGI